MVANRRLSTRFQMRLSAFLLLLSFLFALASLMRLLGVFIVSDASSQLLLVDIGSVAAFLIPKCYVIRLAANRTGERRLLLSEGLILGSLYSLIQAIFAIGNNDFSWTENLVLLAKANLIYTITYLLWVYLLVFKIVRIGNLRIQFSIYELAILLTSSALTVRIALFEPSLLGGLFRGLAADAFILFALNGLLLSRMGKSNAWMDGVQKRRVLVFAIVPIVAFLIDQLANVTWFTIEESDYLSDQGEHDKLQLWGAFISSYLKTIVFTIILLTATHQRDTTGISSSEAEKSREPNATAESPLG